MLFAEKPSDQNKHTECPLTKNVLGRYSWSFLHTLGFTYPEKPTEENRKDMNDFIHLFAKLYPCKICSKHFQKDISKHPIKLESREQFSVWICEVHNTVI